MSKVLIQVSRKKTSSKYNETPISRQRFMRNLINNVFAETEGYTRRNTSKQIQLNVKLLQLIFFLPRNG